MMQMNCALPLELQEWKKELRLVLGALEIDRYELAMLEKIARAESDIPLEMLDFRDFLSRVLHSLTTQTDALERLYMQLPDCPTQDR